MTIAASYPAIRPSLLLDFANTQELDPRITFTRATTATYYDGVTTALAEQNLALYSAEFDNAFWVKGNSTITANSTTAPDGTATADSLVVTASGALTSITSSSGNVGVSGQPLTISIYAKADTATVIQLSPATAILSAGYANFDLSGGTVGNIGGTGLTAAIASVGNGWYRCSITIASASGAGAYTVAIVDSTTSARQDVYTGSAGNGLYIWGIQVEQRSSITAYTATTTQPITNYIPVLKTAAANVARFDHNPTTGESLGLLIEEQRTNLQPTSQNFSGMLVANITTNSNVIVAPDGTLTGTKLILNNGNTGGYLTVGAGQNNPSNVSSIYAKAGEFNQIAIGADNNAGYYAYAIFNLTTGSYVRKYLTSDRNIASYGIYPVGNGWYRIWIVPTNDAGFGRIRILSPNTVSGINSATAGDGYAGLYIWGHQVEAGSFPTSYIPTTSMQQTRIADAAGMTGTNFSSWYRQDESSFYVEATSLTPDNASGSVYSSNNIVRLGSAQANTGLGLNQFDASTRTEKLGVAARTLAGPNIIFCETPNNSFPKGVSTKIAFAYAEGDQALSYSGVAAVTGSATGLPIGLLNSFGLMSANTISGYIKKVAYYPQRLTNANLQALTA